MMKKNTKSTKKTKVKKNTKWSKTKPQSNLRRRSPCAVAKGKSRPLPGTSLVKTEIEVFFLFNNEHMIDIIVERTNEQTKRTVKRLIPTNFLSLSI